MLLESPERQCTRCSTNPLVPESCPTRDTITDHILVPKQHRYPVESAKVSQHETCTDIEYQLQIRFVEFGPSFPFEERPTSALISVEATRFVPFWWNLHETRGRGYAVHSTQGVYTVSV